MKTMQEALDEFRRKGWAVSAGGMLRENAVGGGEPKKFYFVLYPALFGKEVWGDPEGSGSFRVVTPRFTGHGKTLLKAALNAFELARASRAHTLYFSLHQKIGKLANAVEARNRGRTEDDRKGEGEGLDGL